MTGQPSPSPPSQSCGRAVADPRGTGYQSWGVLKGTGWWTSCAGQSVAAQPSARWTGTGHEREVPESKSVLCHFLDCCFTLITEVLNEA